MLDTAIGVFLGVCVFTAVVGTIGYAIVWLVNLEKRTRPPGQ